MKIEIKKANSIKDAKRLSELDRRMFEYDAFAEHEWLGCKCFWIIADGERVGSIAMKHEKDFLYIVSTGILPEFQGRGIGDFAKRWEIEYAKNHGFKRIESHVRLSNEKSLRLNEKHGFKMIKVEKDFYKNPSEDGAVMQLLL